MKKGFISLAASALLASSLMAAPKIAQDGTGDYLIAPMYTFTNGYTTKIVLMNTDNEHAYFIRGVIWDQNASRHVKDFSIMMSPGDVWEAEIKDGKIISVDDSNWNNPLEEELRLPNGEIAETGYVEFYVLGELNNDNPDVASKIHRSNYTDAYKLVTTDVASINKSDLKNLFAIALGGENIASTSTPNLDYLVSPKDISNDAIGGYVTIQSTTHDTLSTTIPLFAFEDTRENGAQVGAGFIPGDDTRIDNYISSNDQREIRNLLRYSYASIPYSLDNSDARINFTFVLDHNQVDEGATGRIQDRTYKQNFRNMSEKYPQESISCLEGKALTDYITSKFDDAANPNISRYIPPTCKLQAGYKLYLANEVDGVTVSQALAFEATKTYKRIITYYTKDHQIKTVVESYRWNDVDPADYKQGMFQIHDIQNVFDLEDGTRYDDGQTIDSTLDAAYIPTYYDIKVIDGRAFINWNYAITNK